MDKESILDNAKALVTGDRAKDYGTPLENMAHIANMWNAYLDGKKTIEPHDVAQMMIHVKQARASTSPLKADHYEDIAGYAAVAGAAAWEGLTEKVLDKEYEPVVMNPMSEEQKEKCMLAMNGMLKNNGVQVTIKPSLYVDDSDEPAVCVDCEKFFKGCNCAIFNPPIYKTKDDK